MRVPLTAASSLLLSLLLLSACASDTTSYSAPSGITQQQLEADHAACIEESSITRLGADQKLLEQQCMMTRGYHMDSKS